MDIINVFLIFCLGIGILIILELINNIIKYINSNINNIYIKNSIFIPLFIFALFLCSILYYFTIY